MNDVQDENDYEKTLPTALPSKITDPIDKDYTRQIATTRAGVTFSNYGQIIEFAKLMAETGWALPPHLRKSQTGCLAICTRAGWWQLDPYFVAEHSYLVKQYRKGVGEVVMVAYDSAIYQAVINSRAPIKHRLRHRFDGEGDDMTCTVWTTFIGDSLPTEHRSPRLGDRRPKEKEEGKAAPGSPLWRTKPRVQLAYDTMRDFARLYCQDVLGGIYDRDELLEQGAVEVGDEHPSPRLIDRLPGRMEGAGFSDQDIGKVAGEPARKRRRPAARKAASGDSPPGGTETKAEAQNAPTAHASPGQPAISDDIGELFGRELPSFEVYRAALVNWLDSLPAGITASDIIERYDSERPLRAGMTAEENRKLQELVTRKFEQYP